MFLKNRGEFLDILEQLWYNESLNCEQICDTKEYKELIRLVNRHTESLKKDLSDEKTDLFLRYCECRNELSDITELNAFKCGFKLALKLMIETANDYKFSAKFLRYKQPGI